MRWHGNMQHGERTTFQWLQNSQNQKSCSMIQWKIEVLQWTMELWGGRLIDKGHPKSTILHNSIGDFFKKCIMMNKKSLIIVELHKHMKIMFETDQQFLHSFWWIINCLERKLEGEKFPFHRWDISLWKGRVIYDLTIPDKMHLCRYWWSAPTRVLIVDALTYGHPLLPIPSTISKTIKINKKNDPTSNIMKHCHRRRHQTLRFFMDLNRSLESILWRYATMETKMLISEDAQTLNTVLWSETNLDFLDTRPRPR